jgi:hypothetical protein
MWEKLKYDEEWKNREMLYTEEQEEEDRTFLRILDV